MEKGTFPDYFSYVEAFPLGTYIQFTNKPRHALEFQHSQHKILNHTLKSWGMTSQRIDRLSGMQIKKHSHK